jgi:hypothetical protein
MVLENSIGKWHWKTALENGVVVRRWNKALEYSNGN